MKVSFKGKVRKVGTFPSNMAEMRKVISRKFTERNITNANDDTLNLNQSKCNLTSLLESQDDLKSFMDGSHASKRRINLIDW